MFALMASDIRAKAQWVYGENTSRARIKALLTDGSFAMVPYRLMQPSQRHHLSPLPLLFNKLNGIFGPLPIVRGPEFVAEFVLIHSYGVVINSAVRCGKGVKIEHLVTIGAEGDESPILGDNVFVGAGAKIIGPITIGNNVKIGANAVVTKDIPPNTTAVGIPAKVMECGQ